MCIYVISVCMRPESADSCVLVVFLDVKQKYFTFKASLGLHMCMIQLQLSKLLLSFIKIFLICFCSTKHVQACCRQSLLRCDKRKEVERRRSFKVFVFFTVLSVSCASSSSFSSHKVVEVFRRVTAGCEDGTHFPLWAGPILWVHHFFLWFIDWWTCFSKIRVSVICSISVHVLFSTWLFVDGIRFQCTDAGLFYLRKVCFFISDNLMHFTLNI